jgi:deoxyribodipyrimidine photo-lyase
MGDADPALAAPPKLPAAFVFDAPLLARLNLSGKRLVFLAETLANLAQRREVLVHRRDPVAVLRGHPGGGHVDVRAELEAQATELDLAQVHRWPWLARPHGGSMRSCSAWAAKAKVRA